MFISLRGRLHQLESQVETAEQSIKQRLEHSASIGEGTVYRAAHSSAKNPSKSESLTRCKPAAD